MYRKILVALDRSVDLKKVVTTIRDIQESMNSEVVVFHSVNTNVTLPMNIPMVSVGSSTVHTVISPREIAEARLKSGLKFIDNVRENFNKVSIPIETRLIENEKPENYIHKAIEDEEYDLVILGCKGDHSKIRRIVKETVPGKVLNREERADVLIIR